MHSATFQILNRYKTYKKQRDARYDFYSLLDILNTASVEEVEAAIKIKTETLKGKTLIFFFFFTFF